VLILLTADAPSPMRLARSSRLAAITRALPFALDDFDEARGAYGRWRSSKSDGERQVALLWAYGYILRYYTRRFVEERTSTPSDYDAVIDEATRRLLRVFDTGIDDPDKFPQFVSVLCKNVLRSFRERRRLLGDVEETTLAMPETSARLDPLDRSITREAILDAIDALPPSQASVVRLRLLKGMPYPEVAKTLDLPIDSARTYYSRAISRLRDVPELRAIWYGDADPEDDAGDGDSTELGGAVRSGDLPSLDT